MVTRCLSKAQPTTHGLHELPIGKKMKNVG